jgi:hypothetical protein
MINAFRTYNPLNIFWLLLLLILLRVGYVFNAPDKLEFVFVEPFARLLFPVAYEYALPPVLNVFIASVLVFIQALLVNHLCNQYNLLGKPTFLPALMYITVSGLFTPFLTLSAPLLCNFLVIAMLFKLLSLYKGDDAKSTAYDLGMIVALGSLIYLPFIYFFLIIWIALVVFRPFHWREWVAGIMGYATIFFFLAVFYYLNNRLSQFATIWLPLATRFPNRINLNYYNYLLLIPVIIILALCLIKIRENFFRSYVQIRKSYQLLAVVFVVASLSFYVKAQFNLNHFVLCSVPAAVFFAYYFLHAGKKWFYESLYILLLAGILYFQFNTF